MNIQNTQSVLEPKLITPPEIETIIMQFDVRSDAYTAMDVQSALSPARQALKNPSPAEDKGAWAEVLAFSLVGQEHGEKPWGTYFGPMGSGTRDGEIFYFPDATDADASILEHWKSRATSCTTSTLVARYNDLVWDMSKLIADENRDVVYARRAIDAYLVMAGQNDRDAYDAFPDAERALVLSIQLRDETRRDAARSALLALHAQAVANGGMWWRAPGFLKDQPKAGLTDAEQDALIADLEAVLNRCSDIASPETFDPHDAERAAQMLIPHYRRRGDTARITDLHVTTARVFEHFGSMAEPMLAALVYQTSADAYRQAGDKAEAERLQRLVEASNVASLENLTPHEFTIDVKKEEVEAFLGKWITGSKEETFGNIAMVFLLRRRQLEEFLEKAAKDFPLSTVIPQSLFHEERVVAQIGSIDEDPLGHLILQANRNLMLNSPWLGWALERAQTELGVTPDDIVHWANRTGLFGDAILLRVGVDAWFADDHIKVAHILVPQIEAAFRKMAATLGRPTTKPHKEMKRARMVIPLGEMLCDREAADVLGPHGPDLILHFRTLYADPRGRNLRNDIAHGLLPTASMDAMSSLWIIHSLLTLGMWLKPVEPPAPETSASGDK